jgi:phosphomannomutase
VPRAHRQNGVKKLVGSPSELKFGTDGWRAKIAGEYTFANVRRVAQGIATFATEHWKIEGGLLVGYDRRFGSEQFARTVCEVFAGNGIKSYLTEQPTPTPAIAYMISKVGAAGGVIVTASHNPPSDNGIKVRTGTGAAVAPENLAKIEAAVPSRSELVETMPYDAALEQGLIEALDARSPYLQGVRANLDLERVTSSGLRVVVDSMFGAGAGYMDELLSGGDIDLVTIRQEHNPAFPGIARPEPIPPYTDELGEAVRDSGAAVGIVHDGDADRLGIVDENGDFIDQLRVMSLLAYYLLEYTTPRGPIVRTVTTSSMLDRLGELYGVEVIETGVGMKYVAPKMNEVGAMMGGEESGGYVIGRHMPERDGIFSGLLFLDFMARTGKSPTELVGQLFALLGRQYHYARLDLGFPTEERADIEARVAAFQPGTLDGSDVVDLLTADGHKLKMADGSWLLIRFSGTEPLLRIYTETISPERVRKLLAIGADAAGVEIPG